MVTDNDGVLAAFREFLDSHNPVVAIAVNLGSEQLVAAVREFAEAIKPIPLVKATNSLMKAFVRTQGRVIPARNQADLQLNQWRAQLVRSKYEMAMLVFRAFRREVRR